VSNINTVTAPIVHFGPLYCYNWLGVQNQRWLNSTGLL